MRGLACGLALGGLVAALGFFALVSRQPALLRNTLTYLDIDEDACSAYLGVEFDHPFSLILTADPGDFSGTPEAHYIIANLKNKFTKPRDTTVCGGLFQGSLMGQPAVVVTTGIGPAAASLCTLEILSVCGDMVKEMLYFGTSGWSPQLGGVLNPPACEAANNNRKITRLGDVCVSPFSVNWTCKKSTWAMQAAGYPNQCFRPSETSSPNATILYGECQFYSDNMEANLDLADELLDVASSGRARRQMPRRSPAVTSVEQMYWKLMGNATRVSYPVPESNSDPTLWNYKECMEVDGQFFFSGVPFEVKARDYAAETLTAAFKVPKTSGDVIAVSAMEGIGVAEALLKYHKLASTDRLIPYSNVRTLSNWLHQPVAQVSPGVWQVAAEPPEDFVTGYGYAIATGSATILSLYQGRCEQDVDQGRLPRNYDCSFFVDYPSAALDNFSASGRAVAALSQHDALAGVEAARQQKSSRKSGAA